MSTATIASQLANRNAMSAVEAEKDGNFDGETLGNGSQMNLVKPSMMSIGESHQHDEEQDQMPIT